MDMAATQLTRSIVDQLYVKDFPLIIPTTQPQIRHLTGQKPAQISETQPEGWSHRGWEMLMHRPVAKGNPSSLGTRARQEAEAALGHSCPQLVLLIPLHISREVLGGSSHSYQPPNAGQPRASITSAPRRTLLLASTAQPAGLGGHPGAGTGARGRLTPCGSLTK